VRRAHSVDARSGNRCTHVPTRDAGARNDGMGRRLLGTPPGTAWCYYGSWGSEKALLMKTAIAPRVTGFSGQ
jgi:hypothetical protein